MRLFRESVSLTSFSVGAPVASSPSFPRARIMASIFVNCARWMPANWYSSSRGRTTGSRSSGRIFLRFSEASDTSLITLCDSTEFGESRTINAEHELIASTIEADQLVATSRPDWSIHTESPAEPRSSVSWSAFSLSFEE